MNLNSLPLASFYSSYLNSFPLKFNPRGKSLSPGNAKIIHAFLPMAGNHITAVDKEAVLAANMQSDPQLAADMWPEEGRCWGAIGKT